MVAKVVKLAAVPAALGLASFRVYAKTEERTDEQIAPRELSIYSTEAPELRCVEEKPGRLQTGLELVRAGLQPYVTAVQNTCTSVKGRAVSFYQAGHDTYHFLRDPPPGFLPRVGVITVSGLAGLVLARKGSRLKRIGVPLALMTAGAAVCYPIHTVGVLKVTGKKAYAASTWVASAFKSKPKREVRVPGASLESTPEEVSPVTDVVPQPDELPGRGPSSPEGESVSEASPAGAALLAETPDIGPGVTPLEAALVEEVSLPESSPAVDVTSDDVEDAENVPGSAAPQAEAAPLVLEETTRPPLDVDETKTAKEIPTRPPAEEKPRFVPDPSLLDHGQAHPEDADLYSNRGRTEN